MLENLQADLARHLSIPGLATSRWKRLQGILESQGIWATAVYRFGSWTQRGAPRRLRPLLKAGYLVAFKITEVLTGISLPAAARIGKGLYLGHFGGIIVHPDAVLGEACSIAHGVTIGVLGGPRAGVPQLGDGVYVGCGAKVLGGIRVGDGAIIGANAVVVDDVPAGATAVGVPARIVRRAARI